MNTLLDVAIGLALIFFLASMLCSSIQEILARTCSSRGKLMREGLNSLVPDRWLYLRLINHPMVSSLYRGRPGKGSPPSYLPARNFTLALADALLLRHRLNGAENRPLTLDSLRLAVRHAKSKDLAIGHSLLPILEAAPDLESALAQLDTWFDTAMDRVTGWYKANAQKMLFFIALVLAVAFNIDTLRIATTLSHSPAQRTQLLATAITLTDQGQAATPPTVDPKAELKALAATGLPIGYTCLAPKPQASGLKDKANWLQDCWTTTLSTDRASLALSILGWLLTALATSLGAPFWFDAMKRLVNLRSAGPKPGKAS